MENDEYDYGHNVARYHSDGEGEIEDILSNVREADANFGKMHYKIGRLGPTDCYPWSSTEKTEVSRDGKVWIKVKNTEGFPKELIEEAFGYRLKRGEYKEWIMEE